MGFNSGFKGLREVHKLRVFENKVLRNIWAYVSGGIKGLEEPAK
jgi:hypothetical protein